MTFAVSALVSVLLAIAVDGLSPWIDANAITRFSSAVSRCPPSWLPTPKTASRARTTGCGWD